MVRKTRMSATKIRNVVGDSIIFFKTVLLCCRGGGLGGYSTDFGDFGSSGYSLSIYSELYRINYYNEG